MERIIIIIIFAAISLIVNASKKKTNGGGQRGAAQSGARPAPPQQQMNRPQPTPARRPAAPAPVKAAPQPAPAVLDDTDRMPDHLASGESRECDHGSVGGSMDITTHEGLEDGSFEHAKQKVATQVKTSVKVNVKAPERAQDTKVSDPTAPGKAFDRKKLREAVIMSEILKRPSERMAQRRYGVR